MFLTYLITPEDAAYADDLRVPPGGTSARCQVLGRRDLPGRHHRAAASWPRLLHRRSVDRGWLINFIGGIVPQASGFVLKLTIRAATCKDTRRRCCSSPLTRPADYFVIQILVCSSTPYVNRMSLLLVLILLVLGAIVCAFLPASARGEALMSLDTAAAAIGIASSFQFTQTPASPAPPFRSSGRIRATAFNNINTSSTLASFDQPLACAADRPGAPGLCWPASRRSRTGRRNTTPGCWS